MQIHIEMTGIKPTRALVARVRQAVADKAALHARIAAAARPVVSNHLLDRDAKAKRRPGFPRSGYWPAAAESASAEADETAAWVVIRAPGVRLHWEGGTVQSNRPGGRLALPLRAEFAGKNPREVWPDRKGAFVLASKGRGPAGRAYLAYRDGKALRLAYLLLSSVTLKDKLLPSKAQNGEVTDICRLLRSEG